MKLSKRISNIIKQFDIRDISSIKRVVFVLVIFVAFISTAGCATFMHSSTKKPIHVAVRTSPDGAIVDINGELKESPAIFILNPKKSHKIQITKQGYKTVIVNLRTKVQGQMLGASFLENTASFGWWTLGIGTAVGMLVDSVSGVMVGLETEGIFVTLQPGEGEVIIEASELMNVQQTRRESADEENY